MAVREMLKKFTYEKRTIYMAILSIVILAISAIAKFVLAYIFRDSGGGFFTVSGIVNIFMLMAKLECYMGIRNSDNFKRKTFLVAIYLLASGIIYIIYMARLFYYNTMHIDYPMSLAIAITAVAFVEMAFSIKGLFTVRGKGHFYRDIKVINFCGAILAIVLAQVSLLTLNSDNPNINIIDGVVGIIVGVIIMIFAVFIYISPKISLVDRGRRTYKAIDKKELDDKIFLTNNRIYGRCYFEYEENDDKIDGIILREDNFIVRAKWYYKIIIAIFFIPMLIPFILGASIYYFICCMTPSRLDKYMMEHGYEYIKK